MTSPLPPASPADPVAPAPVRLAATVLDPAAAGAGALAAVTSELIAPLASGASPRPLPWQSGASSAQVAVDLPTRYPLALVTLLTDLEDETLDVSPTLVPLSGPPVPQPPLHFARRTAAGSALVACLPPLDAAGTSPAFTLTCAAHRTAGDGSGGDLTPDQIRAILRVDLTEGLLGRLLAVLLDEKARLRQASREIRAMRALDAAADGALDRIGADLSCPRFADELIWDAERRSPGTRPLSPPGTLEDDASYRARLRVLRGVRLPSPPWIDSAVNGPGDPADPGTGWMADVGMTRRIGIDESANPLLLAFRLVAPGASGAVASLLDAIRRVHLVWPAGSATGDAIHALRMVPPEVVARTATVRQELAGWQLPDGQPVAPSLAFALTALNQRCQQLQARPWPAVLAGQSDTGGSRFELGLGALLAAPSPAQLDAAVAKATALGDPALVPKPRDADPAGAWLLNACGLRTAEQGSDGTVFTSTAPMGPLVVDVSPGPESAAPLALEAHLASALDTGHDAPMVAVVRALAGAQLVPVGSPADLLAAAQPPSVVPNLVPALQSLGLPVVTVVADVVRQLGLVSARDYEIFDLGPQRTAGVVADPATLESMLNLAAQAGASSGLPLVTAAGTLALILGVTGLPLAGSNLAARFTVLYRWEVRGLGLEPVDLAPRRGPAVTVRAPGDGISVVACLVHLRTGANDPYEWRPALAPDSLLTLRQYEHLLNIIELVTPVGVRADTFAIRQQHVNADGSGRGIALTPGAARAYRHYRLAH